MRAGLRPQRRHRVALIPFGRTVIHPQFHPLEPEWIEFAGDPRRACTASAATAPVWSACTSTATTSLWCTRRFLAGHGRTGLHRLAARPLHAWTGPRAQIRTHRRIQRLAHRAEPGGHAGSVRHQSSGHRHLADRHRRWLAPAGLPFGIEQSGHAVAEIDLRAEGRFPRARRRATSAGWKPRPTPFTARSGRIRTRLSRTMRRHITFTSDRTGHAQVYVADLVS